MQVLNAQITACNAQSQTEVVSHKDDGSLTIGAKRNLLTQQAKGRFVVSIDDDDTIHPQYLSLILGALRSDPDVDCIGLRGEMVFADGTRQRFVYSNAYPDYRTRNGVMTRPPHHLNPVRRDIALAFPFEHVRAHEDADVALRMACAGVLKREVMIDPVLYIYQTRRNLRWHRLLERTEGIRHPLGIKMSNVVPLRRAVRTLKNRLIRPSGG
jgi:hypothetical protein